MEAEDFIVGEYVHACMYCGSTNITTKDMGTLLKHKCHVCKKTNILTKHLPVKTLPKYKVITKNKIASRSHRYIASKLLKRKLTADELVHHINFNRSNNRKNNLDVVSFEEHSKAHISFLLLRTNLISKKIILYNNKTKTYYINPKLNGVDLNETKM